jgi:hypothetical protein
MILKTPQSTLDGTKNRITQLSSRQNDREIFGGKKFGHYKQLNRVGNFVKLGSLLIWLTPDLAAARVSRNAPRNIRI